LFNPQKKSLRRFEHGRQMTAFSVALPALRRPLVVHAERQRGHGGIVWDASLVLAAHVAGFVSHPGGPLRVLELGAGCGLPSLAAAAALPMAAVLATDKAALLPLLRANAEASALPNVAACELLFGASLAKRLHAPARFDVVLGSDIVGCLFDGCGPLLKTLRDLLRADAACEVLLAHRPRAEWEQELFDGVAAEGWACELVAEVAPDDVASLKRAALAGNADVGRVAALCCESGGHHHEDAEEGVTTAATAAAGVLLLRIRTAGAAAAGPPRFLSSWPPVTTAPS
jgi:hypothetical protein